MSVGHKRAPLSGMLPISRHCDSHVKVCQNTLALDSAAIRRARIANSSTSRPQRLQLGRLLPPARVIQIEARKRRREAAQYARQLSCFDVTTCELFEGVSQSDSLERSFNAKSRLRKCLPAATAYGLCRYQSSSHQPHFISPFATLAPICRAMPMPASG